MNKLIDLKEYPVNLALKQLIEDRTTKENILLCTDIYGFSADNKITYEMLTEKNAIQIIPRVQKSTEKQKKRTKNKGEVFTPSWICNKMNNICDKEWFGRENVFNIETEKSWITNPKKIIFQDKTWQEYVDSNRLEIACGEAPYLCSRYDTTSGEFIPSEQRIGLLDRKLRVVNENTNSIEDWLKWTYRAFQSCYGYEYQGDNLLIARINMLMTFVDYLYYKWHREPTEKELKSIANIISWNLWQMDGLKGTVPVKPKEENVQLSMLDYVDEKVEQENQALKCRIFDWRDKSSILYESLKEK